MPIGIVNDDDFALELERLNGQRPTALKVVPSPTPVLEGEVVDKPSRGRSEGDNNVPDSLRKIIGETALIDGRQEAVKLAGMFGLSPSSASAYANGATSTTSYNNPSKSIIAHINKSRAKAIKKAQRTMNGALDAITQEKLDYADPKDLSSIAKDMSAIIKNLEPEQLPADEGADKRPQFVIFAPQFRDERNFESIVVNE